MNRLNFQYFFLVLAFAFMSATAGADTVFKCRGADGNLHYQNSKCVQAEEVSSWGARSSAIVKVVDDGEGGGGSSSVVISKDAYNAYRLQGAINGTPVRMVVDTGASLVAVPAQLARKLKLRCYSQLAMSTANGITQNCKSVVHSLQIGQMLLPDVEVVVMENLNEVLLGQTALGRLKVEQSNGEIRLSTLK